MDAVEASLRRLQTEPHRSLPDPCERPRHPDRRDSSRSRHPRHSRQSPLHRRLELAGLEDRQGAWASPSSRISPASIRSKPTTPSPVATSNANSFLFWKLKRWVSWSGARLPAACSPVSSAERIRSRKTRAALSSTFRIVDKERTWKILETMAPIAKAHHCSPARISIGMAADKASCYIGDPWSQAARPASGQSCRRGVEAYAKTKSRNSTRSARFRPSTRLDDTVPERRPLGNG